MYVVEVDCNTKVFHCSCRKHERTGIPCRHIASVVAQPSGSDGSILLQDLKGFPPSAVKTFWWTSFYYNGIMDRDDPNYDPITYRRLLKMRELDENGRGFICPKPLDEVGIRVPREIQELADSPPDQRLLNYPENAFRRAGQLISHSDMPGVEPPPAGYYSRCPRRGHRFLGVSFP